MRNIVGIQEQNGWQQQTTLYNRHFDENEQLTRPGELHLLDILEVTPTQYRAVYIQTSFNTEIDDIRLANTQQKIVELTGGAESPEVMIRRGRDHSRPASEVQAINELYDGSIPTPRLAGGGGGGGGGASAGLAGAGSP